MLGGDGVSWSVGVGIIVVLLVFLVRGFTCMSGIEDIWAWFLYTV